MPKQHIEEKEPSFFDFLRLGESYTSLILGIVVVIVSTVLLLSFVHNKNKVATPNEKTQVALAPTAIPTPTEKPSVKQNPTVKPTVMVKKATPTPTVVKVVKVNPTKYEAKAVTPTPNSKAKKPTVVPTKVAKAPTSVPTKVVKKKAPAPVAMKPEAKKGVYTVSQGDNLWIIAEKNYKSGYNWVDIARTNNLNNPNSIHVGDKLVLPKVKSKVATVVQPTKPVVQPTKAVVKATPTPVKQVAKVTPTPTMAVGNKITGKTYKIVQGDTLWDIAVRAYADGYQWVKIASANKLLNPDLIHPGNVLTLPRK
jgi:nucleoid-associated protein YgaU